jgi:hypothetical protein
MPERNEDSTEPVSAWRITLMLNPRIARSPDV